MTMRSSAWINNRGKYRYGFFTYLWHRDYFVVQLQGGDRTFIVHGDSPEWGNWKRVTSANCPGHDYDGSKYCRWCDMPLAAAHGVTINLKP